MPVGDQGFANPYQKPLGFVQVASFSTLQSGLPSPPAGATMAIIAVEGNAIRWRDDGTNATASVGMPVAVGQTLSYTGTFSAFTFIPQTGSATVDISYYG